MTRIKTIADLGGAACRCRPRTVLVAGGERPEDLELAQALEAQPYVAGCLLVGNEERIRAAAEELGMDLGPGAVLDARGHEEVARRTVECVRDGRAGIVLKGNVSSPVINRAMLALKTRDTVGQVTLFEADCLGGGRPLLFTDPGLTTVCDRRRLRGLAENAAEVARLVLGIPRPRVALLAANEKVIESLPSTRLAADLAAEAWQGMVVYGPLSFDLAVDPEAVRLKEMDARPGEPLGQVAGRADVLVCPGIDSANLLYKVVQQMAACGLARMASITVGLTAPYVILSRADRLETKLDSAALCCLYAERTVTGTDPTSGPSPWRTTEGRHG